MNAKEGYIIRFLDGADKKFVIPVYQRPYSWRKVNCKLLFEDLMHLHKKEKNSHFFGSLVYVETELGGVSEYIIIDGQQRLTTVSLLLLAIRNYIVANNLDIGVNANKILESYLTDKYAAGAKKLKLKLIQGDDDAYDRLIEKTEPVANNNITLNYNYFYEKISSLNHLEVKGLYDSITKLMVVNISLQPHNGDDPQMIFESLNSTGLDLEESDKIRNFILMKLTASQQEKIYKNYWEKLELKIGKNDMNKFVRYYLSIKNRELCQEKRLYYSFKELRDKYANDDITYLLTDMLKFGEYYSIIKYSNITDSSYLSGIARIKKLEINTVIPLLFDLLDAKSNGKLTDSEMEEAVEVIESYVVRRMICGLPPSSLNKIFVYIGAEIEKYLLQYNIKYLDALVYAILSRTGKSRYPNNHEFSEKFIGFELYNAKPAAKKFLLERLENYNSRERIAVEEQINNGELTIEHIMPQKLTREWKENLGDQWELIHTKYIDTIGNLTLTAYNSDYSNLSFEKKKNMKDKGFTMSKLSLNNSLKNTDVWGEKEIQKRAKELLTWALNIWKEPKTQFVPDVIEEWVTLDDDINYTHKTVVKFKFLGDEIISDNITDVYRKVNELLYIYDPELFSETKSNYRNSNPTTLRMPYELSPTMYIETNLSSQSKITILRELFELFEIDTQELQLFVRPKLNENKAFDINDNSTFDSLKVGRLAYCLISKLLTEEKISDNEINLLMTKEYSRNTFEKVVYPVLAKSVDSNRGGSTQRRYYKAPVLYNGTELFITSQWFEESRGDLVNWYSTHK